MKYLLVLVLALFPCFTYAGEPPFKISESFKAEQVVKAQGQTIDSIIYASGDKLRMEAKMAGMNTINIVRKDQSKIYTIMVDQKIYMEMPFSMDKRSPDDVLRDVNAKWEDLGADTVNGIACQKYKIVSADKGAFFWLSKDKKQPVRMQTEDGKVTVDWKSFVAGPQDDKLFEVPAGFTKMDMPNIDPSMMDPSKMPKIPTGE